MALSLRNEMAKDYQVVFNKVQKVLGLLDKSKLEEKVISKKKRKLLESHQKALENLRYLLFGSIDESLTKKIKWKKYLAILKLEKKVLENLDVEFDLALRWFDTN